MRRPGLEVADIFHRYGAAWRAANAGHVSLGQLQVMSAIEHCRSAALGGHVELAWTPAERPADGVKQPVPLARLFGTDELDALVEMAAKRNAEPFCNVYIGAALRHPDTPRNKRTSDADAWSLTAPYGDLDKEDAVKNARAVYGENKPTLITLTGEVPHARIQPWWRLTEPRPTTMCGRRSCMASALPCMVIHVVCQRR